MSPAGFQAQAKNLGQASGNRILTSLPNAWESSLLSLRDRLVSPPSVEISISVDESSSFLNFCLFILFGVASTHAINTIG